MVKKVINKISAALLMILVIIGIIFLLIVLEGPCHSLRIWECSYADAEHIEVPLILTFFIIPEMILLYKLNKKIFKFFIYMVLLVLILIGGIAFLNL